MKNLSENEIILEFDDGIAYRYLKKEYEKRHPKSIYWTMGNGKKINIKDMDDEHLLNAMKLIERKETEILDVMYLSEEF